MPNQSTQTEITEIDVCKLVVDLPAPTLLPPTVASPTTPLVKSSKLSWKTKAAFALGHMFNDMTVSIWFSYTLIYFVYRLPGALAGQLLLMGQIADAVCSPLVGLASDYFAFTWPFNKFGRRKTWHFFGVLLSTLSVPLVYNTCLLGDDQPVMNQFAYYAVLVCVFQAAWAMSQVRITIALLSLFYAIRINSFTFDLSGYPRGTDQRLVLGPGGSHRSELLPVSHRSLQLCSIDDSLRTNVCSHISAKLHRWLRTSSCTWCPSTCWNTRPNPSPPGMAHSAPMTSRPSP